MSRYNGNDSELNWLYFILIIIFGLCPPIGVIIVLAIVLFS